MSAASAAPAALQAPERAGGRVAPVARRSSRLWASLIDGLVLTVISGALGAAIIAAGGSGDVATLAYLPTFVLYEAITMALMSGATPGKAACGIWVARPDGRRAGFWLGLGRALLKVVLSALVVVDALFALFRDDRRALHDLMSGTTVRRTPPEIVPAGAVEPSPSAVPHPDLPGVGVQGRMVPAARQPRTERDAEVAEVWSDEDLAHPEELDPITVRALKRAGRLR